MQQVQVESALTTNLTESFDDVKAMLYSHLEMLLHHKRYLLEKNTEASTVTDEELLEYSTNFLILKFQTIISYAQSTFRLYEVRWI